MAPTPKLAGGSAPVGETVSYAVNPIILIQTVPRFKHSPGAPPWRPAPEEGGAGGARAAAAQIPA